MLLSGSGDELCGLLTALFQAMSYHLPVVGPSAFPGFVYWKFLWRYTPCSSSLFWCSYSTLPPQLHVPFQFLVYYSGFFFLSGGESVCPGGYAGLSQGWLWEYCMMLVLTCWSARCLPSRCLPASDRMGALLVSQCNMVWGSFVWAGGSGCQGIDFSCCFFCPVKSGSSISARFLNYRAHAVCFCTLVVILDLLPKYLLCRLVNPTATHLS
jgi:hypothetical protein